MEDQAFSKFKRQIETEFHLLKKMNQFFYLSVCAIAIGIFILIIKDSRNIDSIRTKKIIVEAISGKDRIIISSQLGKSKRRKRSDTLSQVLMLDETANDKVILGAPTFKFNDTIINRSKNGPYGMAFNDEQS